MKTCKGLLLTLVALLLSVPGCTSEPPAQAEDQPAPPEKVVQVSIEVARPEKMVETFTLPGHLEAWEDLKLAAELSGPIRWVGPAEGSRLTAGEEILRIDTDRLESDYERDRVSLEIKSRKLERYRKLIEQQLVSQQELDDQRYAVEEARAELRHSELLLQKSTLRSPVAGVLDDLMADRGEYVTVGQPLARVVQVDRLKVLVDVPEKDIGYLRVGDQIRIVGAVIDGREPLEKLGRILHLAYTADPATRTYRAKIVVDNSDGRLRPGRIVRAHFQRRVLEEAISVPLYALVDRDGRKVVFMESDGLAQMVPVTTGAMIERRIVIEEGLSDGDRVIVKGQQLLVDGARVAVEGE